MKKTILYCLFLLFLFSCGGNKRKENITHLVAEWQGKKVFFPDKVIFTRYLTDTTDYQIPESEYKILIYVDSFGCTSCKAQLPRWKEFISYIDSITHKNIPFLFFFHPKNKNEMLYLLKVSDFKMPVCIDWQDNLNKLNNFPSNRSFQTFLLNNENRVILTGNPIHNLAIKELYIKQISKHKNIDAEEIKTSTKIDIANIDMGTFKKSETKQAIFSIQNTGNKPLVIIDVAVSCDCAAIKFDKHPAKPEKYLQIKVDMTPKDSGPFNETITVKCNTKKLIKLTIKGKTL